MTDTFPAVGQTVVVQFGPHDRTFTRCEMIGVTDSQLELRPTDALSGPGTHGEPARLVFMNGTSARYLQAAFAADATSARVVVVLERRAHRRHNADFVIDITVAGESRAVRARMHDVSFGGLCAKVDEPLPVGLRTSVKLADTRTDQLRFVAEVVASRPTAVHMKFVALSDEARTQIAMLGAISTHQDSGDGFDREV